MQRHLAALVLAFVGSACGKENRGTAAPMPSSSATSSSSGPDASPSPTALVWTEFWGAEYQAPAGTQKMVRNGTLPGPHGLGGVETGVRPSVTLSLAGVFHVQIVSAKEPTSLDGMERAIRGSGGRNLVGKKTRTGWELTYDGITEDDASTGIAHILYFDIAGRHFECTYGEEGFPNPAAADAVCRSLRPATPR